MCSWNYVYLFIYFDGRIMFNFDVGLEFGCLLGLFYFIMCGLETRFTKLKGGVSQHLLNKRNRLGLG